MRAASFEPRLKKVQAAEETLGGHLSSLRGALPYNVLLGDNYFFEVQKTIPNVHTLNPNR